MPERTAGGLFLPDDEAMALLANDAVVPPFASPKEPEGEAGFALESGFASAYFITDPEAWQAELHQPVVHFFDGPPGIETLLAPAEAAAETARPLWVVAPSFVPEAVAFLVVNKLRGIITASAIATSRGDELRAWLDGRTPTRVLSGRARTVVW